MAASTQAEISKWIETLRFVCGIKMIENDHHKTGKPNIFSKSSF